MLFTLHVLYINSLCVTNNIYNIFFLRKREREREVLFHIEETICGKILERQVGAVMWTKGETAGEVRRVGGMGTVHGCLRNTDTSPINISLG